MGWTTFPSRGRATVDILKTEFVSENEYGKWDWLDHSERGSVVYAVLRFTPKDQCNDPTYVQDVDGSYRFIAVFLTSRRGEPGYDFGYKDITETMGPVEKDCPERLLRLASPFRDDYQGYGRAWREACRARRVELRTAKAAAPMPGQHYRTLRPVKFHGGAEHSQFQCVQLKSRGRLKTAYRAAGSDSLYRFRPATYGFEIIAATDPKRETPA